MVYSILMLLAKLCTATWLLPLSTPRFGFSANRAKPANKASSPTTQPAGSEGSPIEQEKNNPEDARKPKEETPACPPPSASDEVVRDSTADANSTEPPRKARSLYPAAILGLAMVSRGEVAFLIASVAEAEGIFSSSGGQDLYLIVMWAAMLCTIAGPLGVGILVKRVKNLETRKCLQGGSTQNVLGSWGVGA